MERCNSNVIVLIDKFTSNVTCLSAATSTVVGIKYELISNGQWSGITHHFFVARATTTRRTGGPRSLLSVAQELVRLLDFHIVWLLEDGLSDVHWLLNLGAKCVLSEVREQRVWAVDLASYRTGDHRRS